MAILKNSKELSKLRTEDSVGRMILRLMYARPEDYSIKNIRKECLFLPSEFGPMWVEPLSGVESEISFFDGSAINSPEIIWPMKVGYVSDAMTEEGPTILFNYWQTESRKRLRGKVRFTGKYNVGWYHGRLPQSGRFLSSVMYAAWIGARWKTAPIMRYDSSFMDAVPDAGMAIRESFVDLGENDIGSRVALGQSIALTFRYEWGAQFSFKGSPKVIVPTTPRGILELFNDREKPEGNDRRKALKHWVSEHIRRKRAGSFSHVISHLRGELSFTWRGFDVEIKPAQFDIERIQAAKK